MLNILKGGKNMKKTLFLLGFLAVSLFMAVQVMATPYRDTATVGLAQKNPADWSVVPNGASGSAYLFSNLEAVWVFHPELGYSVKEYVWTQYINANARKLLPMTSYTLIYYGFGSHNDEWNYATCIKTKTTDYFGSLSIPNTKFTYTQFLNDGKGQKFWIVPTADLDCANHKFNVWNPTSYLFELQTI